MKRLGYAVICLVLSVGVTGAQSLGDVAKKEKERRKATEKDKPVRVITEQDLGTGSPEMDDTEDAEVEPSRAGPSTPAPAEPASNSTGSRDRLAEDPWNDVFAGFREAYFEARQHLDLARQFQSHCENRTKPPPLPPIPGGFWLLNCEGLPDAIEQIRSEMNAIQNDCFDRARRMGVPPGRARLN